MIPTEIILFLSILLQFWAAIYALKLIQVTGRRLAWICISFAILLMAFRRCITVFRLVTDDMKHSPDQMAEGVALLISVLIVVGISRIHIYFQQVKKLEEERSQAESLLVRFGRILDHSFNEIYIFNAETWKFIQVNFGACKNLQYSQEELTKLTPVDLKPGHTKETFAELVMPLREKQLPMVVFETVHKRKDGTLYPVLARLQLMHDEVPPVFVAIIGDITEQKKYEKELESHRNHLEELVESRTRELEKSLQRTKSYFDMPLMGSAISNLYKGFTDVNEEMCRITGYRREELLQKTWAEITHPDDLEASVDLFGELLSGVRDTYTMEERYIRKDGAIIDVEIYVGCVRKFDGNPDYFVTMVNDVSDRKEVEAEKERLSQMKTDFLSTAAHELRTPLTTIRGFSELISTRGDFSEEQVRNYSGLINTESENLADIIDDLLDLSRIESGKSFSLNVKLASPVDSVNKEIEAFKHLDTGHKFSLETRGDPYDVFIDPEKMQQVFRNLYSNSVKYAEAGCEVSTTIEFNDDAVLISVSDKGKGMSPDELDHIFEKFYRTEGVHKLRGTGLGMSIVKHLIDAHAGKIRIESETGKGTTVALEIPRIFCSWSDEYSVKVPSLDDQHKVLFELMRKMGDSVRRGEETESSELILDELVSYASFHLKYEESLLEKYRYPRNVSMTLRH
jgi:PAS domain S-box-containing protein